ncbi:unnamed protein product [Withania somnifera]
MESCCIEQFLKGKTIFITGVTGYLAKILTEKILRVQPNVKKLYLLIRAPDSNSAKKRFNDEVLKTDLFGVLREKLGTNLHGFIEDKVFLVPGDIACDSLGISSEQKDEMCREIDIIVNSAATTRFDERYDTAIGVNVLGAMHILKFSKQCSKLRMLLHISTAYVCGEKEGLILEKPLNYGETLNGISNLDIQVEQELVEEALKDLQVRHATEKEVTLAMRVLGIERATLHGWPNTYTFTKAMGEMLLGNFKEDLQLIILRPTIILSTYKEPFPGWIEGLRTIDTFIVGYGKGKQKVGMAGRETIADVKNPWIDTRGKTVKVKKFHLLDSMDSLHKYMAIHYIPSLKILNWANFILCQYLQGPLTSLQRRINRAIRLAELYRPYAFFKGRFDDTNAEMLRVATRESNAGDTFDFDPRTIHWGKYLTEAHIPGLVKHIF